MNPSRLTPHAVALATALLGTAALLATGCSGEPEAGSAAAAVKERRDNYRRIGEAYKQIKESIESGTPDAALVMRNARLIRDTGKGQAALFPPGSTQAAGEKTRALARVWDEPALFARRHEDFLAAADALIAADSADLSHRYETLTQACLDCHQDFRERR